MASTMAGRGARGSNAGKAVPDALKANPPLTAPPTPKAVAVIPSIKKGALSKDVGPLAIKTLAQVFDDEAKVAQLAHGAEKSRHIVMANLTQAIVKAAKADQSIDLTATVASGDKAAKAMGTLNDQLGIALGFREVVTVGEGDKAKQKIVWAKSVAQFFPVQGDDKDAPEVKRKNTFRGNFVTLLKRCGMTALGIIERNIETSVDKKAGTLMLSGPEIKKQFGTPSVLLNEKQTVQNAKGDDVKLTEKPSFTAIAAKAAVDHGKVINRTSNTRGSQQTLANPGLALDGICTSMVQALDRLKAPNVTKAQIASVKKVESAIETWLTNNDKED